MDLNRNRCLTEIPRRNKIDQIWEGNRWASPVCTGNDNSMCHSVEELSPLASCCPTCRQIVTFQQYEFILRAVWFFCLTQILKISTALITHHLIYKFSTKAIAKYVAMVNICSLNSIMYAIHIWLACQTPYLSYLFEGLIFCEVGACLIIKDAETIRRPSTQ